MKYNTILIPLDGSKVSEYAFEKGIDVAVRNDAKLVLTHIVDIRTYANVDAKGGSLAEKADNIDTTDFIYHFMHTIHINRRIIINRNIH